MAEVIVEGSEWLLAPDRDLVRAVFARGLSTREASSLTGLPLRRARRRVRLLARRVLSAEFQFVMARREGWPPMRRRVATACVLEGRTLREAATFLRVSLHTVRTQMDVLRAMMDEGCSR